MALTQPRSSFTISKPLSAGLMAGAAVSLLWFAARRYGRDRADQILDWDQITSIALRTCAVTPPMSQEARTGAEADYTKILRDISEPLSNYTGVDLELGRSEVRALDRPEWIHANVANFRELLQPFEQLYRELASGSGRGRFDLPG